MKKKLNIFFMGLIAVSMPGEISARPLPMNAPDASDGHAGDEYVLFGKSMFDKENNKNMFTQGGMPVSYPVWIDFSKYENVSVDNLIDVRYMNGQAAKGAYNESASTLTIETPHDFNQEEGLQVIGANGTRDIILVGGHPYGIGYYDYEDRIVFDVSADKSRLIPGSGFSGTELSGGWEYGYTDIIYDAILLRKVDGIGFRTDKDEIDMGSGYVGNTYTADFTVYNVGTEPTDFAVTPIGAPCITLTEDAGSLAPGEFKTLTVMFTPDKVKSYSSTLIVESEEDSFEIEVTARAIEDEDYSPIVTAGDFTFSMRGLYPWLMDEIDGVPVARNNNTGIANSTSSFSSSVKVGESQRGILRFAGVYDPRFQNYDEFYLLLDGEEVYRPENKGNFENGIILSAGEHSLEFVYEKGVAVESPGYEYGKDVVYITSLSLESEIIKEYDYDIDRESIDFGRFFEGSKLFENETVTVNISNKGYKPIEFVSDSAELPFNVTYDTPVVNPQSTGSFSIMFVPDEKGSYESDIVLTTTAGDIVIPCKALVEEMPDYSAIVKNGEFTFDTDRYYPFVMKDGKAVNSTSKMVDDEERLSYFVAYFTVPAGSVGNVRWKGMLDAQTVTPGQTPDLAFVVMDESYLAIYDEKCEVTHHSLYPEQVFGLQPGEHSVYFCYSQNGDGEFSGEDMLAMSELSLDFERLPETKAELWDGRESVDFGEVFSSQSTTQTLNIANTGKSEISVTGSTDSRHFFVESKPDASLYSLATAQVTIKFDPAGDEGMFEECVEVITTAGIININCKGEAKSMDNILLLEDFDNGAAGWMFFDKDEDSDNQWYAINSGSDPNPYAHAGSGCLVSCSFNDSFILPDNYAVSPEFTVPEEGAELTWWVAATDKEFFNEIYDVIIGCEDDMATYETVFTEKLDGREYRMNSLDLSEFKGKTVSVIFRHHSESYEDYLLLDDVMVAKNTLNKVNSLDAKEIKEVQYYDLNGLRLNSPSKGMYVRKTVYSDGTVKTEKVAVK